MDHLVTKREAIRTASDAAITVLRVDTIIMAKQSGACSHSHARTDTEMLLRCARERARTNTHIHHM